MKDFSKTKQLLSRTFIIHSLVWAAVMISSYLILGEDYQKISLILLMGFFVELLRYASVKNTLVKAESKKG
tara:strand:- start:4693 stop:4905 length:213 start_codon:yes stop_codon:yes gene_type:complete